jgi:flagellar protein FliL
MSNAPAPATPDEAAEPPKKKGKGKLILFSVIGLVILLGGGGAGYWVYASRAAAAAAGDKKKPEPPAPTRILEMDPFVVNLADGGGSRFLRVTLQLVVEDNEAAREIVEQEVVRAKVRSALLERLALQMADHLVTPEGKKELKKEIGEQAAHSAHGLKISDVLFSEFVVQF